MMILNYLKGFVSSEQKQATRIVQPANSKSLKDIDFYKAVHAHVMWKKRLQDYVDGVSTEDLDHSVICLDNKCDLGKWIYGAGNRYLANEPLFQQLKDKHASFHINAAKIVELKQIDNIEEAKLIINGDYSTISKEVIHLITNMNKSLNSK